jgi:hypothetical protein
MKAPELLVSGWPFRVRRMTIHIERLNISIYVFPHISASDMNAEEVSPELASVSEQRVVVEESTGRAGWGACLRLWDERLIHIPLSMRSISNLVSLLCDVQRFIERFNSMH